MAKRKRPENVSPEELAIHKARDAISNFATRAEKTAWQRQYENLVKLTRRLEPIEDKLLQLTSQKSVIIDELLVLRRELAGECIHPFDLLVEHEGLIVCKFCEKKMVIPDNGESTEAESTDQNG